MLQSSYEILNEIAPRKTCGSSRGRQRTSRPPAAGGASARAARSAAPRVRRSAAALAVGKSPRLLAANFTGLVLGCIETKFCK